MKTYLIRTAETNTYYEEYVYTVKAENEEQAKELVKNCQYDDCDMRYQEYDGGQIDEIISVEEDEDTDNS